ncbi:MAG: bifunctional metallophosphatase/5'-nucleotidase [Desulfobacteraceae bacterium]|nr:bifunctional metallophosphatase/5'-nucleotidase [Desulfobacteraceae bacterium]
MNRIYVDLDDVISRTTDTYSAIIEQEFGRQVRFEDLTCFDLKVSFKLTEKEYRHFFDRIHQSDMLMGFDPVPGAKKMLARWIDDGHRVDIVTGRPPSAREASLTWLDRQKIVYTEFIMVDKYNRSGDDHPGVISKTQLMACQYDLAVEDSLDTALFLAEHMAVPVLLYDRPWNARPVEHPNITRVGSWRQIAEKKEIQGGC